MLSSHFTEHIANARAIMARAFYPSSLLDALNASKRSTATSSSPHTTVLTSSAVSAAATTRLEGALRMSTPHYTGAAIVATVGLGHASVTGIPIHQRLARLQATQFSRAFAPIAMPRQSLLVDDMDVDDEVPRATTPYIPAYWSMAPLLACPVHSPTAAVQPNKASVGVQTLALPPPSSSTSPSWSSPSGSDFSFECATPSTAPAEAPRVVGNPETARTSATATSSPDFRIVDEAVDAIEVKFAELAAQYQEAVNYSAQLDALGSGARFDSRATPHPDDEDSDVATEYYEHEPASVLDISLDGNPCALDDHAQTNDVETKPDDGPARALCELYNPHSDAQYSVFGIVGKGSFARVAAAMSNGRTYGIKVVHKPHVYGHPQAREMSLLEMKVLADVTSFNTERLVRLHESWEDQRNIYFAMVSLIVLCAPPSAK